MSTVLLPDDEELRFRENHYKRVLDVLDSDICCAICNSDLKKNIILSEYIMLHEMFLCLCCEECFIKLSKSQNGCILCLHNDQLKTCEVCNSNMCERCIDNYCSMSKHLKTLEGCLKCSTNALWSHRSQADAVLKCFSFELDLRLILSGEDTLVKQNIFEYIMSTAKCVRIIPNDIHKMRIKYLFNSLNSKMELAFYDYQKVLQTKDIKQCIERFTELCEVILKSTCTTLLDFKCLFNEEIIKSLNNKVLSVLRNSSLFNETENSCNKSWKMSCENYKALNHKKNELLIFHKPSDILCNVSLEKQNEKIIKQYSSNMYLNTESCAKFNSAGKELTEIAVSQTVHEKIEKRVETIHSIRGENIKNFAEYDPYTGHYVFRMINSDTLICEKVDSTKLVGETINLISESSSNINSVSERALPEIHQTRCDQMDIDNENENELHEEATKIALAGKTINLISESSSNINSVSERALPEIHQTRCDQMDIDNENENELNEELVSETANLSTESSSNINLIYERMWPKIYLTKCDQEIIDKKNENKPNEEENDETVNLNTESSTKFNSAGKELTEIGGSQTAHGNIFKFTNYDPFEGNYVFRMIDNDTMICENIDTTKSIGETVNVIPESSSNINSIGEKTWPKIYLTRCDQEDIDNKNKLNEELVSETVNVIPESSSNINLICEPMWPKIYLTRCDQEEIDNKNKLNKELVNETVNVIPESSSNINLICDLMWPKIYLTRCDQEEIDNKNKLNKELVNETVNVIPESSSNINLICDLMWPKIYLTRCDQKINPEKKIDSKPTKSVNKRKFQEKPNSKQTLNNKKSKKNKKSTKENVKLKPLRSIKRKCKV